MPREVHEPRQDHEETKGAEVEESHRSGTNREVELPVEQDPTNVPKPAEGREVREGASDRRTGQG